MAYQPPKLDIASSTLAGDTGIWWGFKSSSWRHLCRGSLRLERIPLFCGDEPCWATDPHKFGAKATVGLDSHLRYRVLLGISRSIS